VRTARTPHPRYVLVPALVATFSLAACGSASKDAVPAATTPGSNTAAPPMTSGSGSTQEDARASGRTPIRITFGDTQIAARLDDTATARDLVAQLPLTLTFRDHNAVEKTAPLPRQLSLDGAPDGHDPAAGDIGYWAPAGDLVFYYDDAAPAFDGIVRIGQLDGNIEALRRQSANVTITIELAG
jgi:hypothetical protein